VSQYNKADDAQQNIIHARRVHMITTIRFQKEIGKRRQMKRQIERSIESNCAYPKTDGGFMSQIILIK